MMDNNRFRGYEDIKKDADGLIEKISNEKLKNENQIKHLIEYLDYAYKDTEEQVDNTISELNNQGNYFIDVLNHKLLSASLSLEKSIVAVEFFSEWIKTQYQKILLMSLFALLLVLFYFNPDNSYLRWINYSFFGLPVLPLMIFFIALFLGLKSYQDLNEISKNELLFIKKNRTGIINKFSINEVNISKQKFVDVKPVFQTSKNLLELLIVNIGKTVPFINQAYIELNLLVRYERLVIGFEVALNYFHLLEDQEFFNKIRTSAPAKAHIINDEELWEKIIVRQIIDRLYKQNTLVSENIILLLYNNHNGVDSTNIFRKIINSDEELIKLAIIMINGQRLVQPPPNTSYSAQDVASVLKKVGNFNISEINNFLSKIIRLLDHLESYLEFLERNEINPDFNLNVDFIVNEMEDINSSFEEHIVMLAYKIGYQVFSKKKFLEKKYVEGFSRASISLKFHDDISLREVACKYSAEDYATSIIRSYYEKSKETDRQKTVSINDLLNDLTMIKRFLDSSTERDSEFLKSQLREGKWYDSSAAYIYDLINKYSEELEGKISNVENYTILKEAITIAFQKVNIGTIEKAMDAQMFGAYVIMSASSEGKFMPLIDLLSIRNIGVNEEKKWDYKPKSQIKIIEKQYKVKPKYDFMKFSNSTRIGVLAGESFLEFQSSFLKDIRNILNESNEEFDIGLVIQRITPSKYSFGILDSDELFSNVEIKNLDIARYIARLGSDYVSFNDKMSVMRFEKEDINLLEILKIKSIYEIIRGENDDISPKERKILESPELRISVMKELEKKLGTKNFESLALDLRHNNISKNQVHPILNNIFENYFLSEYGLKRNAKIRARRLSKRFSDALEKLAYLYELQTA